jgi:hypothetical protein
MPYGVIFLAGGSISEYVRADRECSPDDRSRSITKEKGKEDEKTQKEMITAKKKWSFRYISLSWKDKCKFLSEDMTCDIHNEEVAKILRIKIRMYRQIWNIWRMKIFARSMCRYV